jgi:putative Mg2+ transporter-C (MgtC) family protein
MTIDSYNCISIVVSIILGICIGAERQIHKHNAGIRTFTLICLGSTLAMILSDSFSDSDPSRIAAQVVSGISFLGAGIIMHSKDRVYGLTTAACTWITSIVGLTVGHGMYIEATFVTFIMISLLSILSRWK